MNPFIQMELDQLTFNNLLLQNQPIYVDKYSGNVNLVISTAGTHLPDTVWSYMSDEFFDPLCNDFDHQYN